jgi:hypothetical protein
MNARPIVSAALITLCLAVPAAASAATRYAEPGGDGPEPCLQADPCDINDATEGHVDSDVVNGDEIVLLPGDYSVGEPVVLGDPNLKLHGQAGQPRPRIVSTASAGIFAGTAGVEISHLEVEQSGDLSGIVTNSGANVTIDEVRVHTFNPAAFSFTCQLAGTVTMRNSVCWSSGHAGGALGINTSGGRANVTLRNVTAISTATTNSHGIYYGGNQSGTTLSLTGTNVIADGVTDDVYASASSGASSTVSLDHSNYDYVTQAGTATVTEPGTGTNQTAPPVYLDAATGGFHQAAGSPTIDQGANDPANGALDIDLNSRTVDGTTDIGADEFIGTDTDADGVLDGADGCPNGETGWTSKATTDHDSDGCRDAGEDADDDNDGKTDAADGCPAGSLGWTSTPITDQDGDGCRDGFEDGDVDGDGVVDGADNCPAVPNADQADVDDDRIGDACDPTDDRPVPPPAGTPPGETTTPPGDTTTPPDDGGDTVDAPADRTAPDTIVDSAPAKGHQKRRVKVLFHSTEAGARFECSLDGKAFAPCSSPLNIRASAGRRHRVAIRAIDAAGNVDQTPAVVRWRVRAR